MTAEELLLQLKDIRPPAQPEWWLIAPAHLVIVGLVLLFLAGAWLLRRRMRAGRLARLAEREFELIKSAYQGDRDGRMLALKTSRWLKQVALLAYPAQGLEGVCGKAWLEFLDQDLDGHQFSRGIGQFFGGAVYGRDVDVDANQIIDLCERWLIAVKPRLQQRGKS